MRSKIDPALLSNRANLGRSGLIAFLTTHKNNFLLFFVAFICSFIVLHISSAQSEKNSDLEGYFQLVENASAPILLADQRQQFNLQIGALIRNTPIAQVRLFDTEGELLFRVQNTAAGNTTEGVTRMSNPLLFEGVVEGLLEIDIQSSQEVDSWLPLVWRGFFATCIALMVAMSSVVLQNKQAAKNMLTRTASATDENSKELVFSVAETLSKSNPHLILVMRTLLPANSFDTPDHSLSERLDQVSRIVFGMAKIYGAKPVSITANNLIFVLEGTVNRQAVHQATMFCWGLTQIANEHHQGAKPGLAIQSYVVDSESLNTDPEQQLSYWTELDAVCASGHAADAFLSGALAKHIDSSSFELRPGKKELVRIGEASDGIQKLWRNQRLQLDKKNEH